METLGTGTQKNMDSRIIDTTRDFDTQALIHNLLRSKS